MSDTLSTTMTDVAGRIDISEEVVASIAGIAARAVEGVHALGRSRLIPLGDRPNRGVSAEVGKLEAAVDLELITEYGVDIRQLADKLRRSVAQNVEQMTGRRVIEVNLKVVGVHLKDEEEPAPATKPARVR